METPAFTFPLPINDTTTMILYGGIDLRGFPQPPLEFNYYGLRTDPRRIRKAKFEAMKYYRTHVVVRNPAGEIIYNGKGD